MLLQSDLRDARRELRELGTSNTALEASLQQRDTAVASLMRDLTAAHDTAADAATAATTAAATAAAERDALQEQVAALQTAQSAAAEACRRRTGSRRCSA
jgi:peptidoglycan hydrolase CwlO-like protein